MRIAVISKADSHGGGASRIAEDLAALLNRSGHEADHLCRWSGKGFGDRRLRLCDSFNPLIYRAQKWVKRRGFVDVVPFELPSLLAFCRERSYDLLHFHDLSSAISPLTLTYMSRRLPVVWTLHDCSGFTGGCLYPMGCERFKTGCGACPQLGTWPINTKVDRSHLWWKLRRNLHGVRRVKLITPSQWMADMAFSSGLLAERPDVIANGVDTDVFAPHDKAALRAELNLPADRMIILLSANNVMDERKGAKFAADALRQIRDKNPLLLLVGNADAAVRQMFEAFERHEPGYIGDPQKLARIYAAADVFLFSSLADNQPLTLLETMAAGTPVVGFATGGAPEVVVQDETGFLVPSGDINALSKALQTHLNIDTLARWGKAGRGRATTLYSQARFLGNHVRLYENILHERQAI